MGRMTSHILWKIKNGPKPPTRYIFGLVEGLNFREYPNKRWPYMVLTYLHFRIRNFPLILYWHHRFTTWMISSLPFHVIWNFQKKPCPVDSVSGTRNNSLDVISHSVSVVYTSLYICVIHITIYIYTTITYYNPISHPILSSGDIETWLVVLTSLKNNGKDYPIYEMENKNHVWNHQPGKL